MALRADIESGSRNERQAAIERLARVDDPLAVESLENVFGSATSAQRTELTRLMLETIGHISHPGATAALLRWSLEPQDQEVRAIAADQLKKRPMYAYVPQLIAALPGRIKTQANIELLPSGDLSYQREVLLEGRQANLVVTFNAAVPLERDPNARNEARERGSMAQALRDLRDSEAEVRAVERRLNQQRERVRFALHRSTDLANSEDPDVWEKQYNDYYGLPTQTYAKPTIYQYASRLVDPSTRAHSCFAAGTPIHTADGLRPIETIKPGDQVLAKIARRES